MRLHTQERRSTSDESGDGGEYGLSVTPDGVLDCRLVNVWHP
ncbi:MAG: hypothetical protein AAGA03_10955 [Planctomycetota bacterium]